MKASALLLTANQASLHALLSHALPPMPCNYEQEHGHPTGEQHAAVQGLLEQAAVKELQLRERAVSLRHPFINYVPSWAF